MKNSVVVRAQPIANERAPTAIDIPNYQTCCNTIGYPEADVDVFSAESDRKKLFPKHTNYFKRTPVTLQWKDITLKTKEGVVILNSLNGSARSGELTAVMGPSGAGKTSLMNVLSGFTQLRVTGQIVLNGVERDIKTFRKLTCYIFQDSYVLPVFTVRELVTIASRLKIPTSVSEKERERAVNDVIHSLGLAAQQHQRADSLSGGERKRLCIAQEIVNNPPLIFLDEPTSGLDSSSCLQCIELLKTLAEEGRNVICTIHQPSSKIYDIFDNLYMISNGQCIYRGSTKNLLPFLANQGLECPKYHNPTDFVTDVAIGLYGEWNWKLKNAIDFTEKVENNWYETNNVNMSDKEKGGCLTRLQSLCPKIVKVAPKESLLRGNHTGYATSAFNQFNVLTYKSFVYALREPMSAQIRFFSHVGVGLLVGVLYFGIGNDASNIINNCGFLFFSLMFLIFQAMMPTLLTFPMEKTIFAREHFNNWYSIKIYYMAKTISEIPFQIFFPVIYCSIVYWMTAQPNDLARFGLFLLSSIMISLVAQSIGLLVGAATSLQNAVVLAPVVSIPIFLFGGFFISLNTIPSYLQWLSYISYVRYGYQSVLLGLYSLNRPELHCDKIFCPFQNPINFLKETDMLGGNLYLDYAVLVAFFVVFKFIAYIVLWYRIVHSR